MKLFAGWTWGPERKDGSISPEKTPLGDALCIDEDEARREADAMGEDVPGVPNVMRRALIVICDDEDDLQRATAALYSMREAANDR